MLTCTKTKVVSTNNFEPCAKAPKKTLFADPLCQVVFWKLFEVAWSHNEEPINNFLWALLYVHTPVNLHRLWSLCAPVRTMDNLPRKIMGVSAISACNVPGLGLMHTAFNNPCCLGL